MERATDHFHVINIINIIMTCSAERQVSDATDASNSFCHVRALDCFITFTLDIISDLLSFVLSSFSHTLYLDTNC